MRWDTARGLQPLLAVDQPSLAVAGTVAALPTPIWDPDEHRWRFAGSIPWDAIEQLATQLLEAMASEAAQLVPALLGWRSSGGLGVPAIPPPPGQPASPASTSSLEDLVNDPWRTLGRMLVAALTGSQGREWANALLGWVTAATQGLSDQLAVTGIGSTGDPWAVPLAGSGRAVELVAFVGDRGGAMGGVAARLVPPELQAVMDRDDAAEVTVDVLVTAVTALAQLDPEVAAAVRRNVDVATAIDALTAAITDTDGLVPVAAQHGLGAAAATLGGIGNLALPAAFVDAHLPPGAPPAVGRIFVRTSVRGTRPWPEETAARTIDLTAPGLPAEAFDLSTLPPSGPWFVVLPTRAGTGAADAQPGHDEQVARLRRVVDRLGAGQPAGAPLALIAHGPAGHVAAGGGRPGRFGRHPPHAPRHLHQYGPRRLGRCGRLG